MQKILMVCLGNICRSPLAQGILESKVNPGEVYIDSAGTAAYHVGNLADKRSIEVARKYGINITNQRARKFVVSDFDKFNVIYAMDYSNYQNILKLARNMEDENKVKMILNASHPNKNKSVPDPYYGGNQGFENVFKMLDEACEVIVAKLS
jgi:protein-tyrosine phosphatase